MKIVFTGGGSGGHFSPIIAMVEEIRLMVAENRYVDPSIYLMSDKPWEKNVLYENDIKFVRVPAGKARIYFSPRNISDAVKTFIGIFVALWKMFLIYPDVLVCKGGYPAFPPLVAARILRIPVIVHDSDTVPGRVSLWAAKFAKRIAISYPEAEQYFSKYKDKTALIGIPIRRELLEARREGAHEFLSLREDIGIVRILGGSQGMQRVNDVILEVLPDLLNSYQIIHQVGKENAKDYEKQVNLVLENHQHRERYKMFDYLNQTAMAMSGGAADLCITRAGSTTLAELALWQVPAIVIPIPEDISRDQNKNAFAYARSGSGVLLEEKNLRPHILLSEIERILTKPDIVASMKRSAQAFAKPDAGRKMARAILDLILEHEN